MGLPSSHRAAPTPLLDEPLSWKNFQVKFELLLDLEELQQETDFRRFDVPNDERKEVEMQRDRDLLVMEVSVRPLHQAPADRLMC